MLKLPGVLGVSGHWLLTGDGDPIAKPADAEKFVGQVRELLAAIPPATSPPPTELDLDAVEIHSQLLGQSAQEESLGRESDIPKPRRQKKGHPK